MATKARSRVFWQFLGIGVILTLLPPYVSANFHLPDVLKINSFILTHSIKPDFSFVFPFFNLITLLIGFGVFFFGKILEKPFAFLVSTNLIISGFLQNFSISDSYGFAISLSTLSLTLFTAGAWIFEIFSDQNDFSQAPGRLRLALLFPLAGLAVWHPVHPATLKPDFNPAYFLTSGSSLTFCMMATLSLSVLLAYYPGINKTTLIMTSLAGFLIGVGNLWLEFIHLPGMIWVGILHIPLVLLSSLGLRFSFRETAARAV